MGHDVSNEGQVGIDSIRIGGMTLDTLPLAEGAITRQQWSEVVANQKRQEVENILADYPKGTIKYYNGCITECTANIKRIRQLKIDQQKMIDEYTAHIGLCKHRDEQIAKCDPKKDVERIKALKLEFPPYDVEAMEAQINQCRDAIERSDTVIDQEHASISILRETIVKCTERDVRLKPYGVCVG